MGREWPREWSEQSCALRVVRRRGRRSWAGDVAGEAHGQFIRVSGRLPQGREPLPPLVLVPVRRRPAVKRVLLPVEAKRERRVAAMRAAAKQALQLQAKRHSRAREH